MIELVEDLFGGESDFLDSEIVALGIPGLQPQERAALLAAGFGVIAESQLSGLGATVTRLSLPTGLDAEEALEAARPLAPNAVLDLNHLYGSSAGDCPPGDCWDRALIGLGSLPDAACRRGAPIAIIDTPIATGHGALQGANIVARSFLPAEATPAAPDHGTAIAALLVGESVDGAAPLAPGARLLAAETFRSHDGKARADAVAILRGLDWAVSQGARVVGMSIEGSPNNILEFAVRIGARRANLVAAAGNGGPRAKAAYPAAYPEVMAVAAVDRRMRAYESGTRGGYLEIAAPGVGVLSAGPDGNGSTWTGSSFAVPFVVAALLRARAETKGDPVKARALIAETARDLGAPGRDEIFGHGLLQTPGKRCW